MSQTTINLSSTDVRAADGGGAPVLSLAWHPDPQCVGRQLDPPRGGSATIGRGGAAFGEGALDDSRLSREHASFSRRRDGQLSVQDLGSSNGTRLNGQDLLTATELALWDVVQVGRLLVLVQPPPPPVELPAHETILGRSAALASALQQIAAVAPRLTTVLLVGETGTGKELFATALHRFSGRTGRFVAVNCGALSDTLLQSEVFGHVRGAFTGANSDRPGLVEQARGGTLFLDEIGDASPAVQVLLLRLLQEGEYRRVGGSRTEKADVRVVAATHKDLLAAVAEDRFRRDLLARLNRWLVRLPPLRDRREDIPELTQACSRRHAGRVLATDRRLMLRLLRHDWPANVRELDAVVERLVVEAGDGDVLADSAWLEESLALASASRRPASHDAADAPSPSSRRAAAADDQRAYFQGDRPPAEELERVLRQVRGRITAFAKTLGISRRTAYRWIEEEGLDVDAARGD